MSRALIPAALALGALATLAPTAFAAGATTETFRQSFQHTDDHGLEAYTFDVDVVVHMTTRPDGVISVSSTTRQVQTHTVGGVVVDVITSNFVEHSLALAEDDLQVLHLGGHHRYASSTGERCQTTTVWQVVDNELVVQSFNSICPR